MTAATWSFWDAVTGAFAPSHVTCSAGPNLDANTPPGHVAIAGMFDPMSQRVNVATGLVEDYVPDAPADTELVTYAWDGASRCWVGTATLEALKRRGRSAIDAAAGEARLRYVTDIPGQAETYAAKRDQAAAYTAALALDPAAPVPPYVAAEAVALARSPAGAAASITARATAWHDTINPAIESARLAGKAAVSAATSDGGVATARDAAIAALTAI